MVEEEVSSFIRSSFRSVWSLEVLLLLKRQRRDWTPEEIVGVLRASDLVVGQSLDALVSAGLVVRDEARAACYRPAPSLAPLADAAESLYARSPDAVRRLIVGSSLGSIAAFADAFKLRKD